MNNNIREKVSVIIPTRSEDIEVIKKAISSIKWADEILIADSSKTVNGRNVVKKLAITNGTKYIFREYRYSASFKNWAIPQAKCNWILLLDSDEIVTKKLKNTLQLLLANQQKLNKYDGFGIARKHFFFGKFLRWGGRYPLYNVRFFRKTCHYEDRDVHAHILIGKDRLKNINPKDGDILHYSDRNYEQFFERFNRYSDYQAHYIKKVKERRQNINWKEFFTNFIYFKAVVKDIWFFIPGHSILRFLWMYIVNFGFLDGTAGFKIALLYAFQDYVSKTKYYLLIEERVFLRRGIQNVVIFIVALLFGKKEIINNYKECLTLI